MEAEEGQGVEVVKRERVERWGEGGQEEMQGNSGVSATQLQAPSLYWLNVRLPSCFSSLVPAP